MAELYDFQEQAVANLLAGKHFIISGVGSGKTAMAVVWAERKCLETGKRKVLIVTTASKSRTGDFEQEMGEWCSLSFSNSLSSLSVLSWHKLAKWVNQNWESLGDYVVVFDECLSADTLVKTDKGEKEIADLCVGDKVLSYNHNTGQTEYKSITRKIKKQAPHVMYRLLLRDGTAIISTGNHQHCTQDGYKNAEDIKIGDTLYEARAIRESKSSTRKSEKIWGIYKLCDVWSKNRCGDVKQTPERQTKVRENDLLFDRMWESGNKRERETSNGGPKTERSSETKSNREDENKQSIAKQRASGEGITDEEKEWLASDMGIRPKLTRWQRELFRTAKVAMGKAKRGKQGVGNGTTSVSGEMGTWVSQELQVRHRQFLPQDRDRMRWTKPQLPKDKSEGQEERREIKGVRVESIEILELGDIKRDRLYRDPDNVYCIDVEDNHNFFANGVLTHNCQRGSGGVSSGMGKAFLSITRKTQDWAGFTGTPGDTWLKFYPYFTACGLVRNKTTFLNTYASIQTYKGYPEIVNWRNEDKLKEMWADISYAPDTEKIMNELPEQTHKVYTFKRPASYIKTIKTRTNEEGDFLDTAGAMCAELRRQCFTKDKQEWIKDFVEGLESGCVFFYNFVKTGDMLEEIISKALPKDAKVWRIDGKHHDIPTAETIGPNDMVLCQWQSGSEALNLQFLHYWVAVELCYSYSTANQARGRIRRIGQKMPQWYGYLLTENTIEQDILKCLKQKGEFSEANWCIRKNLIEEDNK